MATPGLIVAACAAAWGASPEADKGVYDVSAQWGQGIANSPDDWGGHVQQVQPWAVRFRWSPHAIVDAQAGVTEPQRFEYNAAGSSGWIERPASFRAGAGLQWAPYGLGLQGVSLGARMLAGPVDDSWEPAWCEKCPESAPPADPLPDGVRLEVNPNVRLNWIGHPGFTLGVELGLVGIVCCRMAPEEPRVNGVALATFGWSFAVGEPAPWPAHSRAALSPEDARRRRAHNTAILVTVPAVTLIVVTAFAVHELSDMSLAY